MTRIGGVSACMARICTGRVWVRRMVPSAARAAGGSLPGSATYSVSHRSRAGWSGGMLSASKFHRSVSISGPSKTSKPKAWKISRKSRSAVMGGVQVTDRAPARPARSCPVASASSRASTAPAVTSARRAASAASISSRTSFASRPSAGRSSAGASPERPQQPVSAPDRPSSSWRSASTAAASAAGGQPRRGRRSRSCSRLVARSGMSIGPAIIGEKRTTPLRLRSRAGDADVRRRRLAW